MDYFDKANNHMRLASDGADESMVPGQNINIRIAMALVCALLAIAEELRKTRQGETE